MPQQVDMLLPVSSPASTQMDDPMPGPAASREQHHGRYSCAQWDARRL